MRSRIGVILLAVCLVLTVVSAVMAAPVTVSTPDNTLVQPYSGSTATGASWTDVIGDSIFNTTEIDVTFNNNDVTFKILTPFPAVGSSVPGTFVAAADLAIDLGSNGSFDKGIVLNGRSGFAAGLYNVTSNSNWNTSIDVWHSTGYIYGGQYDQSAPKNPYTQINTGTFVSVSGFLVTQGSNEIDITLPGVNSAQDWNNFNFFWGTGTCDNDGIAGHVQRTGIDVPEPATMLLLGFGLVGLVGLKRKVTK